MRIKILELLYRCALYLYPPAFRKRFGAQMCDDFVRMCLEADRTTGKSILNPLGRAALDVLMTAPREWIHRQPRRSSRSSHDGKGRSAAEREVKTLGGGDWMATVWQDIRFAFHSLAKRPLFTGISVMTLGIGIGGTTAMFSVVDGVLIKELSYRDPATLVSIWKAFPSWQGKGVLDDYWDHNAFPWIEYLTVRNRSRTVTSVAATRGNLELVLTGSGAPDRVSVGSATANLFDLLGVQALLGRTFSEDEVPPGGAAAHVVLLSHELWTRRFGGAADVIGHTVRLEGEVFEIVGVLPNGFRLPSDMVATHDNGGAVDDGFRELWVPLGTQQDPATCGNCLELIGRLSPERTLEQAQSEVQAMLVPGPHGPDDQIARVVARKDVVTAGFGTPLLLLLGAAAVLMLIACTNVAGLLLGEATARRQEISIRSALGARRGRIVRQLLTESVLLGILGAAVGVALAWAGTDLLLMLTPPLPRLEEVALSGRVLLFATGAGVGTGLLFGLVPALHVTRHAAAVSLHARTGNRDARSLQSAVVSFQVGLTVVLLVVGGLFGQSLVRLMAVEPGFEPDHLATLDVSMPPTAATEGEDPERFYDALVRAVEEIPGVETVATTNALPFPGGGASQTFATGRDGGDAPMSFWTRSVSPSYHETLGIPLVRGRLFSEADSRDAPGVMLVSESMAKAGWPDGSALDDVVAAHGREWTVVGVVGDVRQKGLGSPVQPTYYLSAMQWPTRWRSLAVRTSVTPEVLFPLLREAVWSVDPETPITRAATMRSLMRTAESDDRFRTVLIWTFAVLAVALAAVGIFGASARAVAHRAKELGIRTALGARTSSLIGLVLGDALRNVLIGTGLGLVGGYWTASLISHLLYGVDGRDPLTYAGVAALAILVCATAAYIPARRVAAISPMDVIAER